MIRRILIITSAFFLLCVLNATTKDPFTQQEKAEIEGFSELDQQYVVAFKDAETGNPITGITLTVAGKVLTSNAKGYVTLPNDLIESTEDDEIPFTTQINGYIPLSATLRITAGSLWTHEFILSKKLPVEKIRFVLQWDKTPRDLDLHLVSDDFHISYRDKTDVPHQGRLDRDDTNSYGPETITLDRVEANKSYRLFVHNYSNEAHINAKGNVYVYANNRLDRIIPLSDTDSRTLMILQIVNKDIQYTMTPVKGIR